MAGNNRVAWREGMFLRPQHFQAQDRYIDAPQGQGETLPTRARTSASI